MPRGSIDEEFRKVVGLLPPRGYLEAPRRSPVAEDRAAADIGCDPSQRALRTAATLPSYPGRGGLTLRGLARVRRATGGPRSQSRRMVQNRSGGEMSWKSDEDLAIHLHPPP
jgi:hypothetical protein